jgi:predicted DNA-binding ribbon-helix-helix protein
MRPASAFPSPAEKPKTLSSTLISKNITVANHRTSIRLEPEMWQGLIEICRRERATLHEVCTAVAQHKTESTSLTAAIRVFIMAYYRTAATEDGHIKAGHGQGPGNAVVTPVIQAILASASAAHRSSVSSSFMIGESPSNDAKVVSL